MTKRLIRRRRWTSFRIITVGFLGVILSGSLLLMLPFASADGRSASFFDALFTATSATCVTGLVVQDTATYWSGFGQLIILLLIQIGGMGVVTIAVAVATASSRKIGLMQRSTMQEAIAAPSVGGIVRLTGFILKATFMIEILGAMAMMPVFIRDFGPLKGIWYAVFHSISAFFNAGFDLMGRDGALYQSLTGYSGSPLINIVVMTLIIVGGIGFTTWDDLVRNGVHFHKYRLQSKVVLTTTAILLVVPFLYFYFGEFSQSVWQMDGAEKIQAALFQTVTPRTAGFNTVDLNLFTQAGQTLIIILMLIGGSPGSTAGGMKTTTLAVMFMNLKAVFTKREDAGCFGRRIDADVIKNAAAIMLMYVLFFMTGGIIIGRVENLPILICLFETASAVGTVGLTLGITPTLGAVSRCILIILMYVGRVGGLTLIFAALSADKPRNVSRFPKEKITVG